MIRARFDHLPLINRVSIGSAAIRALIGRKCGLTTHLGLKRRLQELWQSATQGDNGACAKRLIDELKSHVRPEVVGVLKALESDEFDAVMATAAAGDYALPLGRALGFKHILATPAWGTEGEENIGENKLKSLLAFLAQQGWQDRPRILLTDHRDDLPLIRACSTVYWFGSSDERRQLAENIPQVCIHEGCVIDTHLKRSVALPDTYSYAC